MRTKRSREAYVIIDHRASPGISPEYLHANGIGGPAVGAGQTFESAMISCHCCTRDVILNPNRTRERAWCMVHDAYLCDECDAVRKSRGECVSFQQKWDSWVERALKGLPIQF
jgi:hypothetical protein